MEKRKHDLFKQLKKASDDGVLLFRKEKPASPQEIVYCWRVKEDIPYVPDFIVVDEVGKLKEIWYGDGRRQQ